MSKIAFCSRGGQSGILTTEMELQMFANKLNRRFIDEVIPLPDTTFSEQLIKLQNCNHTEHSEQYWENKENGKHGWCCGNCGTVVQCG